MLSVTSKDGTKIAYEQAGSGPAVILVGGALQTRSDHVMGALLPPLAKDFTVISYDRRGRGDSGDTKPYAVEREIEDLEALIQKAGGNASVFGNSSGGNLALLAATKLNSIEKVATYEAPFIKFSEQDAAKYSSDLNAAIASNKYGNALKLFFKKIGMPSIMVAPMSLTPMWSGMKALAPSLAYDDAVTKDGSVSTSLAKITAPTLLITGSGDAMKNAARDVQKVMTTAKSQELKGQSHNVKPAILAQALTDFFKN